MCNIQYLFSKSKSNVLKVLFRYQSSSLLGWEFTLLIDRDPLNHRKWCSQNGKWDSGSYPRHRSRVVVNRLSWLTGVLLVACGRLDIQVPCHPQCMVNTSGVNVACFTSITSACVYTFLLVFMLAIYLLRGEVLPHFGWHTRTSKNVEPCHVYTKNPVHECQAGYRGLY